MVKTRKQTLQLLERRTLLAEETMIVNALKQDHFLPIEVKIMITVWLEEREPV